MSIRVCIFIFIVVPFASKAQVILKGTLLDLSTKEPVPYASVVVEGTRLGRTTGSDGKFTLIIDSLTRRTKIKIYSIGYTTKEIRASQLTKPGQIFYLKPKVELLQEVVVTAYPPRCRLKIQTAQPRTANMDRYWNYPLVCIISGMNFITQKDRVIKTPENNIVKVYPNPVVAGNSFQAELQLEQPDQFLIDLIDASGRVVWTKKLDINATHYNLAIPTQSTLSSGLYILRISGKQSQKIYNGKLMIQ